jgi:hypothetical protein
MIDIHSTTGICIYPAREAVAVFSSPEALEMAVDELEISGFPRAALSVLASNKQVKGLERQVYRTIREIEDDRLAPQSCFISSDSLVEAKAAAVGIPSYIGAVGAIAFVATGGTLAVTVAIAAAGGVLGAGLGALLAHAVAQGQKNRVSEQLGKGGLILWVGVSNETTAQRAFQILMRSGGRDVHVHELRREWTLKDRPFSEIQPDPFLETCI